MRFFKEAGVDFKPIMKDFIGPGLVAGGIVGAATYGVTKDKGENNKWGKAIGAGIVGDAVTGLGQGLWKQRKTLFKAAALQKETKSGDIIRNTHKNCKYFKAEGVVVSNDGNKTSFIVTNTGENFQPGMTIKKKNKYLYKLR